MLAFPAILVDAALHQVYGPEEATRRSLQAAVWTDAGGSVVGRAVGQARRLASRVLALAF